jgi:hypothetical protein
MYDLPAFQNDGMAPKYPISDPANTSFPYMWGLEAAPNQLLKYPTETDDAHPATVKKNKYADTILPYFSGLTVFCIIVIVGAMYPLETTNLKAKSARTR